MGKKSPARSRYAATFPTALKARKIRNLVRCSRMTPTAAKRLWEQTRKHMRVEPKRRKKQATPSPVYLDLSFGKR